MDVEVFGIGDVEMEVDVLDVDTVEMELLDEVDHKVSQAVVEERVG